MLMGGEDMPEHKALAKYVNEYNAPYLDEVMVAANKKDTIYYLDKIMPIVNKNNFLYVHKVMLALNKDNADYLLQLLRKAGCGDQISKSVLSRPINKT